MRDIMCSGYVTGGNTRFFGTMLAGGAAPTFAQKRQAIEDRLSFVDDASGDYESMLAFACRFGDGDRRDQVISISHRLLPWEVTLSEEQQHDYFPGGKAGYEIYKTALDLSIIHHGEDIRAAGAQEFISQGSVNNSLCFIGPHRKYSPWSNTFYELIPGQGTLPRAQRLRPTAFELHFSTRRPLWPGRASRRRSVATRRVCQLGAGSEFHGFVGGRGAFADGLRNALVSATKTWRGVARRGEAGRGRAWRDRASMTHSAKSTPETQKLRRVNCARKTHFCEQTLRPVKKCATHKLRLRAQAVKSERQLGSCQRGRF